MILEFKIIPHRKQRYKTVGDYFKKRGCWRFRVSKMKDARYSVLVFLHEIIEFFMCRLLEIRMETVDSYDITYEKTRESGIAPCGCKHFEEPGDDPHAPYHRPHVTATKCERLIADALGVKWDEYNAVVEDL